MCMRTHANWPTHLDTRVGSIVACWDRQVHGGHAVNLHALTGPAHLVWADSSDWQRLRVGGGRAHYTRLAGRAAEVGVSTRLDIQRNLLSHTHTHACETDGKVVPQHQRWCMAHSECRDKTVQ